MTTRPMPARVVPRRTWALPFARGTRRAVAAAGRGDAAQARPQPVLVSVPVPVPVLVSVPVPSADEDFLRRLREAGL